MQDEYEKEGSGDQVDDTEIEYNYEDSEVQPKEQVTSTTTASTAETQKDATTSTTPENFSSDSTWFFLSNACSSWWCHTFPVLQMIHIM